MDLGTVGANNRLTVGASRLVAGDSLQRRVKVLNTGTEDLATITLTTTAIPSSVLDTDTTNGLPMKIERCGGTIGWKERSPISKVLILTGGCSDDDLARAVEVGCDGSCSRPRVRRR